MLPICYFIALRLVHMVRFFFVYDCDLLYVGLGKCSHGAICSAWGAFLCVMSNMNGFHAHSVQLWCVNPICIYRDHIRTVWTISHVKNAVAFRKNCTMWTRLKAPFTPAIYDGIVIIITFKNGLCTHFGIAIAFHIPHRKNRIRNRVINRRCEQECIPVGCVPPAHWSYLCISSYPMHAIPPEQPRMSPQSNHACPPWSNHACPPRATMHAPRMRPLWTEWQTGVKILPCPKLRLRAVMNLKWGSVQCAGSLIEYLLWPCKLQ